MCFKIFIPWVINEGHFSLFIMFKIGILKNYGGARSRHGGVGRITLLSAIHDIFLHLSTKKVLLFFKRE